MANRNIAITTNDDKILEAIGDSLSSPLRRKIINLLREKSMSMNELADAVRVAPSTLSFHIKILEQAQIVKTVYAPNKKGNEKNVSLDVENIMIDIARKKESSNQTYILDIPIGSFSKHSIFPPCSINTKDYSIDPYDSPHTFECPQRIYAEHLSFFKGYIEYSINTFDFQKVKINSIYFTLEVCSECPNYNPHWKSDISFWLNDIEIGKYRSMGDYGGRKGVYSPSWWSSNSSNYGNLITIKINEEGSFINDEKVSQINLADINIKENSTLNFRIGVKENSTYVGGINLFGKNFGDYPTGIRMVVEYEK